MRWIKSKFNDEADEFDRVTTELSEGQSDAIWDSNFKKLEKLYQQTTLILLNDSIWHTLKNTDSSKPMTMNDIKRSIRANSASGTRDIYAVIREVVGTTARAPIILNVNNKHILIAGNTRLMACRLLDIDPKVIIIKWK